MNGINSFALATSMGGMGYGHYHGDHCHGGMTGVELAGAMVTANMLNQLFTIPTQEGADKHADEELKREKERAEEVKKATRATGFGGMPASKLKRLEAAAYASASASAAAAAGPSLQLQREIAAIEAQKARDEERIKVYEAQRKQQEVPAEAAKATKTDWFSWLKRPAAEPSYQPMKTE